MGRPYSGRNGSTFAGCGKDRQRERCLDPIKDEYLALKSEKEDLIATGQYQKEARTNIARQMGRLLSYPEERIEKMLAKDEN